MIGNGPMLTQTMATVIREGLEKEIHVLGAMSPEEVRTHMEQAQIHIFTSDRNEGWGAVLNESMNSCCVPVANRAIGSAPYLIEDGKNGFLYNTVDELYDKVKYLLDHDAQRNQMAENAYHTITDEWNAENAARKFVGMCEKMLSGEYKPFPYESGVCSRAKLLKEEWHKP
jgi:glycosyltransferase involved in cell wall biosynthesis